MKKETPKPRNKRRSIVSDEDTLSKADKFLAQEGSTVSQWCHVQLKFYVQQKELLKLKANKSL